MAKQAGAASIFVELEDGIITVYHGTDKTILLQFDAEEGDWDDLWNTLRKLEKKNKFGS